MRILSYLLIAVFLLAGCTSVFEQDYSKKSLEELLPLAEQSDAEAQYRLGEMYHSGEDPQYNEFDEEYYSGEGVRRDDQLAAKWWRKSAEQGHSDAQTNLGVMYHNGEGVPKDYVLAYKWVNLAAAQGDEQGVKLRDKLAKRMTPSQIKKAEKLALEFKPKKEKP